MKELETLNNEETKTFFMSLRLLDLFHQKNISTDLIPKNKLNAYKKAKIYFYKKDDEVRSIITYLDQIKNGIDRKYAPKHPVLQKEVFNMMFVLACLPLTNKQCERHVELYRLLFENSVCIDDLFYIFATNEYKKNILNEYLNENENEKLTIEFVDTAIEKFISYGLLYKTNRRSLLFLPFHFFSDTNIESNQLNFIFKQVYKFGEGCINIDVNCWYNNFFKKNKSKSSKIDEMIHNFCENNYNDTCNGKVFIRCLVLMLVIYQIDVYAMGALLEFIKQANATKQYDVSYSTIQHKIAEATGYEERKNFYLIDDLYNPPHMYFIKKRKKDVYSINQDIYHLAYEAVNLVYDEVLLNFYYVKEPFEDTAITITLKLDDKIVKNYDFFEEVGDELKSLMELYSRSDGGEAEQVDSETEKKPVNTQLADSKTSGDQNDIEELEFDIELELELELWNRNREYNDAKSVTEKLENQLDDSAIINTQNNSKNDSKFNLSGIPEGNKDVEPDFDINSLSDEEFEELFRLR